MTFLTRLLVALALVLGIAGTAAANPRYAGFVIDARTGKVLYAENADARRYPASLTKMMTLYLAFEALDAGRMRETTRIAVSRRAAAEPPSKIGLKAGSTITVRDAMLALVTKSANDAATALGEHLGGSEAGFARMATEKARALGMRNTTFRNAHGLPNPRQVTTARDMAILGIALREHFPQRYAIFQTRSFSFGKQVFGNHNRLLQQVKGVDGIKTGYINASGFNLVTSARSGNRSIVAVVMGGNTAASRDAHMRDLIARYMPKASTRGGGGLVAKRGVSPVVTSSIAPEIRQAPVPTLRAEQTVQSASLGMLPVPEPRGAQAEVAALAQAADQSETFQEAAGGWTIQIAATPGRDDALSILERARSRVPGPLRDAAPLVVEYRTGGQTVYRARFAGFSGKDSAWQACGALKKHGFNCWASEG
ncbi:D-alanyl-D-alanine carboxypeptidase [Rhizobiaceae bacterium BDR2-2]|uniref:D-alanyl-D-alanine carboxypeptidase n=1 Tax=Ectorhizobium quercum TaxID=2965071 RepID=A0AAE3N145_9HYPH|nr:D-alanyl-D-alanine carboxypeptidase [Ectorhizobium quercum]MCX8998022.1 D-alanyl-D-alanine carboxypeptidase [Ectorhizobium quercum]